MIDVLGGWMTRSMIDKPIFIVGGSRSGTIALLKALGKHPQILSAPTEDPFITDVGRMALQLDFFTNHERDYYLRTLRISFDDIVRTLRRLAFESAFGRHYGMRHLARAVALERVNVFAKRRWCTKTFPGKETAAGILRLFRDARFVWILRNGVNVVHSRTKFPEFRDLPFREHCVHWAQSIRRFRYLRELPEAIVVKQEDYAERPDEVMRRIFEHVGVPYDPAPTEFSTTHHVHPLAEEATKKGVDVRKVLASREPAYVGWSEEWRAVFKEVCGEAMAVAGYEIEF